jgi:hypothetical protein
METPDTSIVLFVFTAAGDPKNPIVDHPGQPADYLHTDGTVWTWKGRWRPLGKGVNGQVLVPAGGQLKVPVPRGGSAGFLG